MTNTKNNPFLQFSYTNNESKQKEQLTFKNPIQTHIAWDISDVEACLESIEIAINDGYYVAGYLSYEAAPAFDATYKVKKENNMPLAWFGVFKAPLNEPVNSANHFHINEWIPNVSVKDYNRNIDYIQELIRKKETEQVNYTIQLNSTIEGDAYGYYKQLNQAQSNYSAYLDIGDYSILSASPELFFQLNNGKIITKPMKGTVGRGATYEEDMENAKWLQNSKKNQAENEMIINVMQSDLEKIAAPGSINLAKKFEVEKYPTVYQMTSTLTADLAEDKSIIDIFQALFPSGSITGEPKHRTMDLITQLETSTREIYCGALGYIKPNKEAIFNVPIRTVWIDNHTKKAHYGVGGAITSDSTKEEEYAEILTKAGVLTKNIDSFLLLETLGLNNGEYLVLANHLQRLEESASYFNYTFKRDNIEKQLNEVASKHLTGHWKVRLTLDINGKCDITTEKITSKKESLNIILAAKPVNKEDTLLYHKTTNREIYQSLKSDDSFDDVLMWNEQKEITEFTNGNIVVMINGKAYTPPVSAGLLAGTYRKQLLEEGRVEERTITLDELELCEEIWFINSVREWIKVNLNYDILTTH